MASIALASANERPKRSIGYIKNFIGTKLLGYPTNTVYARLLAKNDTHQLFSIPGQNYNILIKVPNNTNDQEDRVNEKQKVNKIVTPEIATLGTYLGTKTDADTFLAIEVAKGLIKSGVLTDNLLHKVLIETKEKVTQPLNIYTQESDPLFIYPPERVNSPVTFYPVEVPPVVIAPEVKLRPLQNKYSYKQFGHDADMKYESYNGKDVIVTRTTKQSPLPEFVNLRVQEIAANGGLPLMRLPVAVDSVPPVNNIPIPYLYRRPAVVPEFVSTVPPPALNVHIDSEPILFSQPIPLSDAVKILPPNNAHVFNINSGNSNPLTVKADSSSVNIKETNNDKKQNVNDIWNQNTVNRQILTKYSYKQINHNNPGQYTEIRVQSPPNVNPQDPGAQKIAALNEYIYVPPKSVNIPSPTGLNSQAIATSTVSANQFDNEHIYTSKTDPFVPKAPKIVYKTSGSGLLKSNPIVVSENKEGNAVIKVNADVNETAVEGVKRGDIPESIH